MSLEDRADKFSYSFLKYALHIEDLENVAMYDKFTLHRTSIFRIGNGKYGFDTSVLHKSRKELKLLSKELSLSITRESESEPFAYKAFSWSGDNIVFEYYCRSKKNPFLRSVFSQSKFKISFIPNRSSFRVCYDTLKRMKYFGLEKFFEKFEDIPLRNIFKKHNSEEIVEKFEWFNDKTSSNKEQIIAIKNVVNCTAFPLPFVIFGPPGTGKTSTLVECVAQIMKHKPKSHILISAQSNSACDEIGKRLAEVVSYSKILRFCSSSIIKSQDPGKLHNISNSKYQPSYEELYHFNVVIITLSTSSRLVQANIVSKHFDYIFIDECGAATEIESLVPIIGNIHSVVTNDSSSTIIFFRSWSTIV